MFTVRSHPPKGPPSAPFSSPGGAVVAFGGRFPALFLLLWACPCIFACLLLCTLFLGICAPGLSAVELYFFVFAWVGLLWWAAPPPYPSPVLFSASRGLLFSSGPSFFPGFRSSALVPSAFALGLLRFFSRLFGASFFLITSFSSWYFFFLYILSASVLCFLGHLFLFWTSYFLVALFPYIFLFIFIYFDLSA